MIDENSPISQGGDPRLASASASLPGWESDLRPAVANPSRPRDTWLIIGLSVLVGLLVLLWLGARRTERPAAPKGVVVGDANAPAAATPPDIATFEANSRGDRAPPSLAQPAPATPVAAIATPPASSPPLIDPAMDARLKAPAMVVDLASGPPGASSATATVGSGGAAKLASAGPAGPAAPTTLNGDEQFAKRVGAEEPERVQATTLQNQSQTVPQGAMIPGVLETALDSDLPGYTRAVVSREVRGFDGSTVLIPRGSRVIGQYKSAVAQGQSRAFVIWTRILRPDGVSIQIGSSGTDPLGRAGLSGTVNRHFLQEFSGAILLSVIDAGISSLGSHPGTEVVIGSSQQATSLAGSALVPTVIPPTIKVPQGTPIRIFVARDLDFSTAGSPGK